MFTFTADVTTTDLMNPHCRDAVIDAVQSALWHVAAGTSSGSNSLADDARPVTWSMSQPEGLDYIEVYGKEFSAGRHNADAIMPMDIVEIVNAESGVAPVMFTESVNTPPGGFDDPARLTRADGARFVFEFIEERFPRFDATLICGYRYLRYDAYGNTLDGASPQLPDAPHLEVAIAAMFNGLVSDLARWAAESE